MISVGDMLMYKSINGYWYEKRVTSIKVNSKGARIIHLENGVERYEFEIMEDDCDVRIK